MRQGLFPRFSELAIEVVKKEGNYAALCSTFKSATSRSFSDGVRTGETFAKGGLLVSHKALRGNTNLCLLRGISASLTERVLPNKRLRRALAKMMDVVLLADLVCTSRASPEQIDWLEQQIKALVDPSLVALLGPYDRPKRGVGKFFLFPKFHLLQEVCRQVRLWGSLQNVSMVRHQPPLPPPSSSPSLSLSHAVCPPFPTTTCRAFSSPTTNGTSCCSNTARDRTVPCCPSWPLS